MADATPINFDQLKVSCASCSLRELCIPQGMSDEELKLVDQIIERKKPVHKNDYLFLSLIHISEPTRLDLASRMPSSA